LIFYEAKFRITRIFGREKNEEVKRELAELLVDDDGCVRRDGRDENG